MPLGLLIAGPVAEKYGVAMWFFIAGIACAAIAVVSFFITRGGPGKNAGEMREA